MPGRIGPLLTTGVALSVAAVVVANPVVAPRADLEIPAVKLSGTGDALDMLKPDFLSRIAPAQTESPSNPFAVLKDLVTSLAADATYLTRNAIVSAFFAGATAVNNPELTATSFPYLPYIPPAAPGGGPAVLPTPVVAPPMPGPMSTEQLLAIAALPTELVPAAAQVVVTLMDGVRGLTDGTAMNLAFAAGALLVKEGGQVVDAVSALVGRGVQVVSDVLTAVANGQPQTAIVKVINDVFDQPFRATRSVPAAPTIEPPSQSTGEQAPGAGLLTSPAPSAEALAGERLASRKPKLDNPAVTLPAVPESPEVTAVPDPVDVLDSSAPKAGAAGTLTPPRVPAWAGPVGDALSQARHQAQGMLRSAVDAVRKATAHAGKAHTGPAGD